MDVSPAALKLFAIENTMICIPFLPDLHWGGKFE